MQLDLQYKVAMKRHPYVWVTGEFEPIRTEPLTIDHETTIGNTVDDHWWLRTPQSSPHSNPSLWGTWETSPWRTITATYPTVPVDTGADADRNAHLFERIMDGRNLEQALKKSAKKRVREKEAVDIDEDSFLDILKGDGDVSE